MSRRLRRELQTLRDDIQQLRSDAGAVIETLLDVGRDQASDVRAELSDRAQDWFDALGDIGQRSRRAASAVYSSIEKRPLAGAAVAFAGIFLLTRLLLRGTRDEG